MELLLHYVWLYRWYDAPLVVSGTGEEVEVLSPGWHNRDAGADFQCAKVRIGDMIWVGNVEVHMKSSQWYDHGHDRDKLYDNTVLHVVEDDDVEVATSQGRLLPQVRLHIPIEIRMSYDRLMQEGYEKECKEWARHVDPIKIKAFLTALVAERLEEKAAQIKELYEQAQCSWERTLWISLARNMGFGVNALPMLEWALSIDPQQIGKHRDNVLQVEAFFLGQGGFFSQEAEKRYIVDDYYRRLKREYEFLAYKFSLVPLEMSVWRYLRLRPQNFPEIRLVQLAHLYHARSLTMRALIECSTLEDMRNLLSTAVTPYWTTHYTFGREHEKNTKKMHTSTLNILLINTVSPLCYVYGITHHQQDMVDKAISILERLPSENNYIVRRWKKCGVSVSTAMGSQALIQLQKKYCNVQRCLECRLGAEYLRDAAMKRTEKDILI